MLTLKIVEAKSWLKCSCCAAQVRTCEKYIQVFNGEKAVRGERYCTHCEKYARMNNDIADGDDGEEAYLRERETYAAYQAAGCTHEYFNDKNNGY